MYCRECGNKMADTELNCSKCETKKGEGINYCFNCGFHTSERTEYCSNCGAKQYNIVTQKVKDDKKQKLYRQLKITKVLYKLAGATALILFIVMIGSLCLLIFRDEPTEISYTLRSSQPLAIPEATYTYTDPFYQKESQELFFNSVSCFIEGMVLMIVWIVEKKKYKKILRKIKEVQ